MDRQESVVSEHEHDHLMHVPDLIWADRQLFRRVTLGLEVHDDERVICRVTDGSVADAVPSSRTMDLPTGLV